jgi:hypothetical protein
MLTEDHRVIDHRPHFVIKQRLIAVEVSELYIFGGGLDSPDTDIAPN